MKRITIKDLARELGVNPSTISRALKDHPDIGAGMRAEVKRLARELNYRPNHMAIQLQQRSSKLIGLVAPEVTMFFYPSVLRGIEEVLHSQGYRLLVLQSHDSVERESENIQICLENNVAGLLLALTHRTDTLDHLQPLEDLGVPVVLFDKILANPCFDTVALDDAAAAMAATRLLLAGGSQRPMAMLGFPGLRLSQLRAEGFRQALAAAGLPWVEAEAVRFAHNSEEARKWVLQAFAPGGYQPDGIFAMSDEVAAGVMPGLAQAGVPCPHQCAVVAISDGYLPYYLHPQVSFLHHSGEEVGRLAAQQLCQRIAQGEAYQQPAQALVVDTPWVALGTTR